MDNMGKSFALILILIMAISSLSLMIVKPAIAQTMPKPSVPIFTVKPVGPPQTVPTTYSLDQSSGKVVAHLGYVIEYPTVVVTIKNQPFTPYIDSSGNTVSVFYNIQIMYGQISNSSTWTDICNPNSSFSYAIQSTDSDYTNISIPVINGESGSNYRGIIPVGTQTDIQVEAMIGSVILTQEYNPFVGNYNTYSFVGQTSSWSPTQTVTIPAYIPLSPTPSPLSSNSSLLLIALIVIAFLLAVIISLLLLMRHRKTANLSK
jgi:hypothetical protein